MKKILIYGTGIIAERYYNSVLGDTEVIAFIETKKLKQCFLGKPVLSVNEIIELNYEEIVIAHTHIECVELLLNMGVDWRKIHCAYQLIMSGVMRWRALPCNTKVLKYNDIEIAFNDDYVRYGTLCLLAEEIIHNGISGDIAELGVYQGKFASHLNYIFNDRKLYLFDTFEGFHNKDMNCEMDGLFVEGYNVKQFSSTSVDSVLGKMKYPNNCIIRKGRFPDTVPRNKTVFAFVSLDCDLYEPILSGLEYFYPRLAEGGYIMLHDYNGDYKEGIQNALRKYEKKYGKIPKVPIPDVEGTIIITK